MATGFWILANIDSQVLGKKFVGREFHSFVYDGPIFKNEIMQKRGEIVLRANRFYFCDLVPENLSMECRGKS